MHFQDIFIRMCYWIRTLHDRLNLFFILIISIYTHISYLCTFHHLTHLSGFVILHFYKPTSIITGVGAKNWKSIVLHIQHFLRFLKTLYFPLTLANSPQRADRIWKIKNSSIGWLKVKLKYRMVTSLIKVFKYPERDICQLKG